MSIGVDILALGMASPLGLSSRATVAALRAGFVAHEVVDEVEDLAGDEVLACRLEGIDAHAGGHARARFFAHHALAELLSQRRWVAPPAVFLAGPESGQGDGAALWASLRRELHAVSLAPIASVYPYGRAGLFMALAAACEQLSAGSIELALVGGADSSVSHDELRRLVELNAVLGKRNRDGLIPGEGAAFFLLARHPGRASFATIDSVALAREPEPRCQGGPPRATGLGQTFAQLRADGVASQVEVVVSAQPRQRWWGREFTYAYLRNGALMPEPLVTRAPCVGLGDLGAAAGGVALGTAVWELHPLTHRRRSCVRDRALIYGCADEGAVGACLIRSPRTTSTSP